MASPKSTSGYSPTGLTSPPTKQRKLFGRAFYESIGSPRHILAPMVDQSEFDQSPPLLAYSPMFHSRLFVESAKYRESHFQPLKKTLPSPPASEDEAAADEGERFLDGNEKLDRPLFVQFCSNSPDDLLAAAKLVQPHCDAVDLNLGCPQGIARKGHYGAFLQEDWDLIYRLINKLHLELDVPVTAKMRILETREKTLDYAKMILSAGASILTVHGRRREQKGHNTGVADWEMIRFLRENLPKETVIFANGNVLQQGDIEECLRATGVDGVMSAEGNLHDPAIFADPPDISLRSLDFWVGRDGLGGYRMDAVMRRYMDIIYRYALGRDPPPRNPLFDPNQWEAGQNGKVPKKESPPATPATDDVEPPRKKQKRKHDKTERPTSPNLTAMQAHLFTLLRPLVSEHHNVRDALARARAGDINAFENVLSLVEDAVMHGLIEYERSASEADDEKGAASATAKIDEGESQASKSITESNLATPASNGNQNGEPTSSSAAAVARCKRPWWICQAYVRPLPNEALEKGSMTLSKKEKERLAQEREKRHQVEDEVQGSLAG